MTDTLWQPRLASGVPVYRAIADALERDVSAGILPAGFRLPTHRELAAKLRVTPLTVTRAYREAARRGLVEATVGRGTFIRAGQSEGRTSTEGGTLDLTNNVIRGAESLDLDARAVNAVRSHLRRREYEPAEGSPRHRAAGAAWLSRSGVDIAPDRVVVTTGAHHAMMAVLGAVCGPGDVVLAEELTYPRFAAIAGLLHLDVRGVEMDEHGIVPAAIEKASRGAKALYVIPNFQNPTGIVMPEKRRREIAAVAGRLGLVIVEDDVYGFLIDDAPRPIAAHAPDITCLLTSVSKSLTPSLRLGFVAAPDALVEPVTAAFAATTAFTSPLSGEIFTHLFERGDADRVVRTKREVVAANRKAAMRGLGSVAVRSHPMSPHLWIALEPGVGAHDLADRARARGVSVTPASAFAVGKRKPDDFYRVAIGGTEDASRIEQGMRMLSGLMRGQRLARASIV